MTNDIGLPCCPITTTSSPMVKYADVTPPTRPQMQRQIIAENVLTTSTTTTTTTTTTTQKPQSINCKMCLKMSMDISMTEYSYPTSTTAWPRPTAPTKPAQAIKPTQASI